MSKSHLRIATLFLLTLSIGLYFYTDAQQDYYDQYAKPAAETILTDISRWEAAALRQHLSQEATQTLTPSQLEQLLNHYRQFGELQQLNTLEFSRLASALSIFGQPRINYQTNAQFSNGAAHINLTLTQEPSGYKIYNLTINKAR